MLRERAVVPPMHPHAASQNGHAEYVRQLSNLPCGTGTGRSIEGPDSTFHVSSTTIEALSAWALEIALRVQSHIARTIRPLNVMAAMLVMLCLCWCADFGSQSQLDPHDQKGLAVDINTVAERIIKVESNGDRDAKNKRSSATGLGQFVNETWLILIRAHRPDLVEGRSEAEILEMRRDAGIAREITVRFTERNAWY